ncbi:ATP-binding domain-containing protein [Noviherbaspirillum sp. 1P10PC]|uniref:ATP-binding domain-containing protein n=1 Tax=Noviherbaspirillum sp. 1P10PC TaxID=3132292 RepID=UPI0039A180C2
MTHIDHDEQELTASLDEHVVTYAFGELDELVLCYATIIHKSQGSEYPVVVISVSTQHYMMHNRNLIYTGIAGGKRLVVLVGQKRALAMAVKGKQAGTAVVQVSGMAAFLACPARRWPCFLKKFACWL